MRRIAPLAALFLIALLALPAGAAAQTSSEKEGAVVVISGDVTVPRGKSVDGIVVVSGDVRVAGHVDGDVVLVSGDALVSGRIDGSLVTFGGRARVLPRAHIAGNIHYGDERPIVAGSAIVRGDVSREDGIDALDLLPIGLAILLWVAIGVSMALLGILVLLISPRAATAVATRSRDRAGPLIAIGIAIAIALPVAAAIAAVTVVALPLGFVILLALAPLWALAYCASAWVLGRRIMGRSRNRVLTFLAGLAILRVLAIVPVLGFVVAIAAGVFGLGLIGAAIGATREQPEPARTPGS